MYYIPVLVYYVYELSIFGTSLIQQQHQFEKISKNEEKFCYELHVYTFGVQNIKDIEVSVPHDQEMFGVCVHHQFIPAWSMQINTKTGLHY